MSIYFPYEIYVGSDILAYSFELFASLVTVFTEGDKVSILPEEEHNDDHSPDYCYEATAKTIRERLELMGYTLARWRKKLEAFREEQLEELQEQIDEQEEIGNHPRSLKLFAVVAENSPAERWIKTLTALASDGWGWTPREGRSAAHSKELGRTDGLLDWTKRRRTQKSHQ